MGPVRNRVVFSRVTDIFGPHFDTVVVKQMIENAI